MKSKYPEGKALSNDQVEEIMTSFIEVELVKEFYDAVNAAKSIGMMTASKSKLFQTGHILKKRGRYFVVHFKQLLALDGKIIQWDDKDAMRIKLIAQKLEQYGFVKVMNPVREINPEGLGLSMIMVSDMETATIMTPMYSNIQLEKKYTFD